MPIGSPQEILPNFERLDLTKLRQDIPKFFPWITPEAAAEWSTFLSGLTGTVARVESTQWPLQTLHGYRVTSESIAALQPTEDYECRVRNDHLFYVRCIKFAAEQ